MAIRLSLQRHPDCRSAAVRGVEIDLRRIGPRALAIRYVVLSNYAAILSCPLTEPARADGLWRHTCLEAFIRSGESESYFEFNLSPLGNWAAYRFRGYRDGMENALFAKAVPAPASLFPSEAAGEPGELGRDHPADGIEAPFWTREVTIELGEEPGLPPEEAWHLGVSAIVEEQSGTRTYWALAHPPGDPDFHHPDCFALELPPARIA